jgi:hypothetical protein
MDLPLVAQARPIHGLAILLHQRDAASGAREAKRRRRAGKPAA